MRSPLSTRRELFLNSLAVGSAATMAGLVGADRASAQAAPKFPEAPNLTFGLTANLRTRPLIDGRVRGGDSQLKITVVRPGELFHRQLVDAEFDVCEMSISSLMMALSRGDRRFVALPVFTTRYFFHTLTIVRHDAGIKSPADLRGRKVGVPEYQQTGALWARGVLQDEFGVRPEEMEFWMERLPERSHAGAIGYQLPAHVHQIPKEKSMSSMLLSGELDAMMMYLPALASPGTDRSVEPILNRSGIEPLFRDTRAEMIRYYKKTGLYHINHCVVVRRSLVERDAELATKIMSLFEQANNLAEAERLEHVSYHFDTGRIDPATYEALQEKLVRYGISANKKTLETLSRYSHEQMLTPQYLAPADVFIQTNLS